MVIFEIILFSVAGAALYLTATHEFKGPEGIAGKESTPLSKSLQAERGDTVGQSNVANHSKATLEVEGRQDSSGVIAQRAGDDGSIDFACMKFTGMSADFVRKHIIPHLRTFESQGATSLLIKTMNFLKGYGDCPSVFLGPRDLNTGDLYSQKVLLAEVSLRDHSYHVAEELIRLVREKYHSYDDQTPLAVITGLSHDIGKASAYEAPGASHGPGHAVRSAAILKELGRNVAFIGLKDAVQAVRDHHTSSQHPFTLLLKEADSRAREIEHMQNAKKHTIKPFNEWFEPWRFMARLEYSINRMDDDWQWRALSYEGVIYCREDLIYETGRKVCREARALEPLFMKESKKEKALKAMIDSLREAGFVHEMLPNNQYSLEFEVSDIDDAEYREKCSLVPLKWEELDFEIIDRRGWEQSRDLSITRC